MLIGILYLVVAVMLSFAAIMANSISLEFSAQIDALVNPANADIYPLENQMLTYFGVTVLAQALVILFAFLSGGRLLRRAS